MGAGSNQSWKVFGGEYRNRTSLHGFAIRSQVLNLLDFIVNVPVLNPTSYQGLIEKL